MTPTPGIDVARIREVVAAARDRGAVTLLEPDARTVLEAMGIDVPPAVFATSPEAAAAAADVLEGDRVVVRVVSPAIAHKTEAGGVVIVPRDQAAVRTAAATMRDRLAGVDVAGWMVTGFVAHDPSVGGSLLVSVRWTVEAGPIVSVGAGGIDAEAIAADLRPGRGLAVLSPSLTRPEEFVDILRRVTAVRLATEGRRGRPPELPMDGLLDVVGRFTALADACLPDDLVGLEVNPFVVTPGGLVALDVLAEPSLSVLGVPGRTAAPRPLGKLPRLLEPRSVALIGVSASMNSGRIILRNLLRDGFGADRISIVKPGADAIDGCSCVPDIASLPRKVDLFVVAVSAAQAAEVVAEVVERDAAETILVVPGGFEEKLGTEAIVARMRNAIAESRRRPDGGPLLNGGNCLGFRSLPGRIDTMFIPASKLAPPADALGAPLALLAQSGAFAITRLSRLADLHPRYLVTVGNQMDLTLGDHLGYLAGDEAIAVYGVYVEGFRPLDVVPFLEAARRIADRGGTVVLYRAGRTTAGARASASHTASIAGDVAVVEALARQAGVLVAGSLDEFDDLVRTATLLVGREVGGRRLGAMSNAGFECVAIGDSAGSLQLEPFDRATVARLGDLLESVGAAGVVDVHNPLDATPMAGDEVFVALAETILASPAVDVGVVGVVPLTAELATLAPGPGHGEDVAAHEAVADRLVDLWRRTSKAWVSIVDGGPLYDPLVARLEGGGMPVFRTADRAMRALDAVVRHRLG